MKSRIPFLFVFLIFCSTVQANNGNPTNADATVTATEKTSYSLDKIFYNDFENDYLFVDFLSITDDLTQINLLRDDKLMMEVDVRDLPGNAIYELNLNLFRSGNYTIELVTLVGVKIHKDILIE